MIHFELTNEQRRYFGLNPILDNWDQCILSNTITVYFHQEEIVKVINYSWGYLEYDANIKTKNKEFLLPGSSRGKEVKFTIPRMLKIKGSNVQFSGSFGGGGIHVYDNKRNVCFIQSYFEEGPISNYQDISLWLDKYMNESPRDYFSWLGKELMQKRKLQHAKAGDIIAFKVGRFEYGFARVLYPIFSSLSNWIHPRSLTIAPYAYVANGLDIDLDQLVLKKALPSLYICDNDVYYGKMPILGHRPLSEEDKQIPLPKKESTSITIPYTKTDIITFAASSKMQ
jgi:Immunity protein 26